MCGGISQRLIYQLTSGINQYEQEHDLLLKASNLDLYGRLLVYIDSSQTLRDSECILFENCIFFNWKPSCQKTLISNSVANCFFNLSISTTLSPIRMIPSTNYQNNNLFISGEFCEQGMVCLSLSVRLPFYWFVVWSWQPNGSVINSVIILEFGFSKPTPQNQLVRTFTYEYSFRPYQIQCGAQQTPIMPKIGHLECDPSNPMMEGSMISSNSNNTF